jgi:hypothetical protein
VYSIFFFIDGKWCVRIVGPKHLEWLLVQIGSFAVTASVRLDTNLRCRYVLLRDPEVTELRRGNNCFLSYIVISLLLSAFALRMPWCNKPLLLLLKSQIVGWENGV